MRLRTIKLILAVMGVMTVITLVRVIAYQARCNIYRSDVSQCINNAKVVSTGLMMYVEDNDGLYPNLADQPKTRQLITPYIKNSSVYVCPVTTKPFMFASDLSQKRPRDVKSLANVIVLRDQAAHTDGFLTVGYVDGHVKLVKANQPQKTSAR